MARVKAWLKRWWWILLLGAVVLGAGLWLVFRKRKSTPQEHISFSTKARAKIVEAETETKIAKLKSETETAVKLEKLNQIEAIEDDEDRRDKLADYLDDLL